MIGLGHLLAVRSSASREATVSTAPREAALASETRG
jgi:hypothetical protein